jgi:hypothetical protein
MSSNEVPAADVIEAAARIAARIGRVFIKLIPTISTVAFISQP